MDCKTSTELPHCYVVTNERPALNFEERKELIKIREALIRTLNDITALNSKPTARGISSLEARAIKLQKYLANFTRGLSKEKKSHPHITDMKKIITELASEIRSFKEAVSCYDGDGRSDLKIDCSCSTQATYIRLFDDKFICKW